MRVEVYESDRDALDAVGVATETALRECASPHPALAVAGGRGGRAIMLSLAERQGIPWDRVRAVVVDDVCAPADEAQTNRRLLREHLGAARGGANGDTPEGAAGVDAAAVFADDVRRVAGAEARFDLIVVELGPNGELGVLVPGTRAIDEGATLVESPDGSGAEARRIGLGPAPFARAARVIVVALGAERSRALKRALCDADAALEPAGRLRPSDRVAWFVDRAAASELLRDAQPVRA
jgi:6-phosphogluconolactonase/glucosamine-6-phosphate isomerase/deaminase